MKEHDKLQKEQKWKIYKNIKNLFELNWLDNKVSYEWAVIYEDTYNQTWTYYFNINNILPQNIIYPKLNK